jgi:hypothetical protein
MKWIKYPPATFVIVPLLFLFLPVSAFSLDQALQKALLKAAEGGDTAAIVSLLDKGADINGRADIYNRNETALIRAADSGKDEVVKLLLARGANPNVPDSYGGTALMYAVAHATTVKALLEAGADVNARDDYGQSALFDAARGNLPDIVRMLIAKGADVNTRDKDGETAWSTAVEKGVHEVAAILRDAGAKEVYDALRWSGQYSAVSRPEARAITNRSMWQHLWTDFLRTPPPLDIDFARYVAVCIFLGTRPTGGYGVEFGTPYEEGRKMVIPFRERKPTGFVIQALTRPFAVKVFARKDDLDIVLKKEEPAGTR